MRGRGRCARTSPRRRRRTSRLRLRLRQSSSVIFHRRSGSAWRASNRRSCSSSLMCSQNLTIITPSSTSELLEADDLLVRPAPLLVGGEALDALDEHPPVPAAVEHGHPAEAGDSGGRSATGSGAASRRASAWRTSTPGSGAGRAARTTRLIAPPLPAASGPSNTSSSPGPSSPEPSWPPMCRRSCSQRRCAAARRRAYSLASGAASRSSAVDAAHRRRCYAPGRAARAAPPAVEVGTAGGPALGVVHRRRRARRRRAPVRPSTPSPRRRR